MNILDELSHTTIRIETTRAAGRGSGTGFFFMFDVDEERSVPLIITNKHVIKGAEAGSLVFTLKIAGSDDPDYGATHKIEIDQFERAWIHHPDPGVDLAAFSVATLFNELHDRGITPFFKALSPDMIATPDDFKEMSAVEEILMIGYPQGFWDSHNNMPITRRGVTATAPYLDFEGRPEFIIDCAVFNGSSGSPVLLFDKGATISKSGGMSIGGLRVKLLGVLWGGPQYGAQGEIKAVPVPTGLMPVPVTPTLMNLGYCVRADQILWFQEHVTKAVLSRPAHEAAAPNLQIHD